MDFTPFDELKKTTINTWYLLLLPALLSFVPVHGAVAEEGGEPRLNIVVIMADDLGWKDLHCYGNDLLDTPVLDQLAEQGMRFTNAYAASPVCSPTRAAMMTGLSPARLALTNHAPGHADRFAPEGSLLMEAEWVRNLDLQYQTVAEHLAAAGYATAHVGKWHLSHVSKRDRAKGLAELDLRPENQGFGFNIGGCSYGGPPSYFSPYRNPALEDGPDGEYLPERLADAAIKFVHEHRDQPFFLSWWPYSVHYPMQARDSMIAKYQQREGLKDPIYAAMIEAMDTEIGRFLVSLDELGLTDNTLVIFKSDNGGYHGDNSPLRGYKGMLYEGGIRIPWIVRWPGVVAAGTECSTPVISTDCFPTILAAAKLKTPDGYPGDGVNLLPLLKQQSELDREAIYFHYPNYAFHKQNRLGAAIRVGNHKLIKRFDDNTLELYDLENDLRESKNLASKLPQVAEQLDKKLTDWLIQTDAKLPLRKESK